MIRLGGLTVFGVFIGCILGTILSAHAKGALVVFERSFFEGLGILACVATSYALKYFEK